MTPGQDVLAGHPGGEYRIEDLAGHSGATVRTIRAYQDRGLLPRPGRRGRANVYDDTHLTRLRQISALLERGYTLASIKELLEAWDEGRGLSGVLGLVSEVEGPWTDEEPERVTRAELDELFGGNSGDSDGAVAEAVELGVLVPLPERPGEYLLPSPQELAVAAELHRAGVPLLVLTEHLRELRTQVEGIAARFMELTDEHIFRRYLRHRPSDEDASEAAGLVRRLRPLAQQTVDAELARAMRTFASRSLREHLLRAADGRGTDGPEPGGTGAGGPQPGGTETNRSEAHRPEAHRPPGGGEPVRAACTERRGVAGPEAHRAPADRAPACGPPVRAARTERRGAEGPEAHGTGGVASAQAAPEAPPVTATAAADAVRRAPAAGTGAAPPPPAGEFAVTEPVYLPAGTLAAVQELVGAEQTAAFIAAAAEREVRARAMDRLAMNRPPAPGRADDPAPARPATDRPLPD